jgi:hypothetical protein
LWDRRGAAHHRCGAASLRTPTSKPDSAIYTVRSSRPEERVDALYVATSWSELEAILF